MTSHKKRCGRSEHWIFQGCKNQTHQTQPPFFFLSYFLLPAAIEEDLIVGSQMKRFAFFSLQTSSFFLSKMSEKIYAFHHEVKRILDVIF